MKKQLSSGVRKFLFASLSLVTALTLLCSCGRKPDAPPMDGIITPDTATSAPLVETPLTTQPTAETEPIPTLPAVTEPAPTLPAVTEPVPTLPAVTEPAPTLPAVTEPVTSPAVETYSLRMHNVTPTSSTNVSATLVIKKGDTFHLAVVGSSGTVARVQWTLSRTDIVSILNNTVFGLASGGVRLTASYAGQDFICDIQVLDPDVPTLTDPKEILEAAYALEPDESLPYQVILTGYVKSIAVPYDPEYQNISVIITIDGMIDKPIKCYRLRGDRVEAIAPGDTITVKGTLSNRMSFDDYEIRFDAGCELITKISA